MDIFKKGNEISKSETETLKRRINEIRVMIEGCNRLKLSLVNYVMILKPIIAAIIPQQLLMKYHRKKFRVN